MKQLEEKIFTDLVIEEHDTKEIVKIKDDIKKAEVALNDEEREIINE